MPKKSRWWGRGEASEDTAAAAEPVELESDEPEEVVHDSAAASVDLSEAELENRERRAEELATSLEGEAHHTRQARARALQQIEKLRAAEQAAIQRAQREENEAERAAAERSQAEQIAHDLAQDEAMATERAGSERASAESAARRRAEAERVAQEHAEIERKARDRAAEEQAAAEEAAQRRIAAERALAEIAESERTTSKRATELRELAQEAIEQRHAAEAALDELRARERATRARIAAERASAAQMAAQRALSAQSALERAQAELAAAERAAADRAQLAHSIAERAAQAVAMADRAQRELGRAERSLADLEGGGDAQSGGDEESPDPDPDPDPDSALASSGAARVAVDAALEPDAFAEPADSSDGYLAPLPETPTPAARKPQPSAEPVVPGSRLPLGGTPSEIAQQSRAGLRSSWLVVPLFPIGLGAGLGVLWALDRTSDADPGAQHTARPTIEMAATGADAAATTLLSAALPSTPPDAAEPPATSPQAPAAVEVAPPAAKPVRESLPTWLRNAVAAAPWDGRPMIALVLEGVDAPAPAAAVLNIAAPLTLVYATDADLALAEARRARRAGHELIAVLPAAGGSAERALDRDLDTPELKKRLARSVARMNGFVGVRLPTSGGIASDAPRLQIVLRELARRGLLLVDMDGGQTTAAGLAYQLDAPFAVRDVKLGAAASAQEIESQLGALERLARERGSAIAFASTSTALVKGLERWLPVASSRGFRIVPLSAVVRHRAEPAR